MPVLASIDAGLIHLRHARDEDVEPLLAILGEADVRRFWGQPDRALVERWVTDADPRVSFLAIEIDGRVVGGIQVVEEPHPDYRHAAVDVFVAERWQRRGVASRSLRAVIRHLFDVRGHHRATVSPRALNEGGIRMYAGVGFRPVGIMRRFERDEEGTWQDGLLMELIAGELKG